MSDDDRDALRRQHPGAPRARTSPLHQVPARLDGQVAGPIDWDKEKTSPTAIEAGPHAVADERIGRMSVAVPLMAQRLDGLEAGHSELKAGQREHAAAIAEVRVGLATVVGGQTTLVSTLAADRLERERIFAADRAERDMRADQAIDLTKTRIAAAPRFWKAIIGAIAAGLAIVIAALIAHGCGS